MPAQTIEQKYGFENPFKPDPLVKRAVRYLPRGRQLLDVGCGEGADSVFFARKGFHVTAIDKTQAYLKRFRAYARDEKLSTITILRRDAVRYRYPRDRYDVVNCLLVICCMKRSEAEKMLTPLKHAVKPGGIIIMSARNYLDPERKDCVKTGKMVETNTFCTTDDYCCKFQYFLEKNRLREVFHGFQILYYYEGFAPCKYGEHPKHGDSYIICRRRNT